MRKTTISAGIMESISHKNPEIGWTVSQKGGDQLVIGEPKLNYFDIYMFCVKGDSSDTCFYTLNFWGVPVEKYTNTEHFQMTFFFMPPLIELSIHRLFYGH